MLFVSGAPDRSEDRRSNSEPKKKEETLIDNMCKIPRSELKRGVLGTKYVIDKTDKVDTEWSPLILAWSFEDPTGSQAVLVWGGG